LSISGKSRRNKFFNFFNGVFEMAQQVTITGRITNVFDGNITDDVTKQQKKYAPNLTILDNQTMEFYKVSVSDDEYKVFAPMLGREITVVGVITRPAEPPKVQALKIEHVKATKS